MASSPRLPGLCLVTDSSVSFHAPLEEVVAEAVSGGVGMVQVREKSLSTGDLYRLAAMLRRVTLGKALLMVNDRLDVALAVEADGVHLPSHSLPTCVVKKVGGGGLLVGRAVHSVEEAVVAEGEGVDYLMLGTIYGTASHPGRAPSGPGLIEAVKARVRAHVYAIGGINASNAGEVMRAGADGVAVIRSILGAPDPGIAAREIAEIVEGHR